MSLRVCLGCGTAYAVGLLACPQCGTPTRNAIYSWEDDVVAHANPQGATLYVDEGQDVPGDVPEGVRLIGPGAPQDAPESEPEPVEEEVVEDPPAVKGRGKGSTPPPSSDESSDPDDEADADDS